MVKHFKRSGSTAFTMSRQQHGDGHLLGALANLSAEVVAACEENQGCR